MRQDLEDLTDARIQLELVSGSIYHTYRKDNPIYVELDSIEFSDKDNLISQGFYSCQGIALYDKKRKIGALAHQSPIVEPSDFFNKRPITQKIPNQLLNFPCFDDLIAFHVYDTISSEWKEEYVESALRYLGIKEVLHLPMNVGKNDYRNMFLDISQGIVGTHLARKNQCIIYKF